MRDIVKETQSRLIDLLEGTDISIYDIEFVKEGPHYYLRVYIDKEKGVGIDDCESVSRGLEKLLDRDDFIDRPYILEVSSPGVNRRLKKESDFIRYAGHTVDIKLFKPINGKKEHRGVLKSFLNGELSITSGGNDIVFPVSDIASAKLSAL